MAKKNVVEVVCERCERTEYVDPKEYSTLPDLVLQFGTKPHEVPTPSPHAGNGTVTITAVPEHEVTVKFEDLCSSCKNTVRNLVAQVAKKINWKRDKGKTGDSGEAVDVEV